MNSDIVIDIQNLSKTFGARRAVDNVTLQIKKAEIVGFLGPNGSGKTTTMRMICGLMRPDGGSGTCLGYNIYDAHIQIKHKIGYMTQKFSLYEDLTIKENLEFVARAYKLDNIKELVQQTLNDLGLHDRQNQLTGLLSGGWKQRLALAASIIHGPDLLLLDEPTAGVDPKARREFWDQIHMLASKGLTVLVSTHYMDEASRCHRIAYILYGKMIEVGTVDEVTQRSGLSIWTIEGDDLATLAETIKTPSRGRSNNLFWKQPSYCRENGELLEASMKALSQQLPHKITKTSPSLEDVFISYTG